MKHLLLLSFLVIPFFGYSQSKSDTHDWISGKISSYGYTDDHSVWHTHTVEFVGTDMIITTRTVMGGVYETTLVKVNKIPIRQIGRIEFVEKSHNVWMKIYSRNGVKTIRSTWNVDNDVTMVSTVELILNSSFNRDLQERMRTAMSHLIEIHGGTPTKETF